MRATPTLGDANNALAVLGSPLDVRHEDRREAWATLLAWMQNCTLACRSCFMAQNTGQHHVCNVDFLGQLLDDRRSNFPP